MPQGLTQWVWETKYRQPGEAAVSDSWQRVAAALASVEKHPELHAGHFAGVLQDFRFLPGGRILAGAGSEHEVTLFNCFVMGAIEDSIDGIFRALRQGALTMQMGGGAGFDFSTLRPQGVRTRRVGVVASGPVSFMRIWNATCATLVSTGNRRGAMMATLRCDHPDIEQFINAKQVRGELTYFNLSVLVTDRFMQAVCEDAAWQLVFPEQGLGQDAGPGDRVMRTWPGYPGKVACRIVKTVSARQLWQQILEAAYDSAEPGVLFVDTINRRNNLGYREQITATNPCGEIPLPPYGGCDLGSINLARLVLKPFEKRAAFDWDLIDTITDQAVRMLDNVIDLSRYPLPQQAAMMRGSRRIGLGITGLGDALIMLGIRYDDEQALAVAETVMRRICHRAYAMSTELAREKGVFPDFECEPYLESPFVQALPGKIRDMIQAQGMRNSHLLAIAPAGTISLLAGNVSSGLEPVFSPACRRRVRGAGDTWLEFDVEDYACRVWRELGHAGLPPALVTAEEIAPLHHLHMQARLQPFVDNAISKTINVPESLSFDDYRGLYEAAWELGLKGCTTYRPNPVRGKVIDLPDAGCCSVEREGG